jgi:CPA1 family monovalent cation:H+ antiporter
MLSAVSTLQLVLGLLVVVAVLALVSHRLHVPYPIVLVLGGLALALVPGLPPVSLAPDVVFLLFLPPLIFSGGWYTSIRDFKANLRPIGLLSIGLVLFTIVGVAAVAHAAVPGLSWPVAFVIGAIVSPTDAIAATAIFERMGVPRRVITVLEGESLVNDATGLVAYRFAVAAVVTGGFSLWEAGMQFLVGGVGGVALGLAAAWALSQVGRRIEDPVVEITLSFLLPYGVYLAAEQLHLSGVLAAVAAGIYHGWRSPQDFSATTRTQAFAVWEMALFVLNGLVFILIGLQLRTVLGSLSSRSPADLIGIAVVVCLAVIAIRFIWVFPATYLPRLLSRRVRQRDPYPPWRQVTIVAWTGMRGVVSLAAALSLPLQTSGHAPFPDRDLAIFLTFAVILVTLVGQGLTLPLLVRALRLSASEEEQQEEADARFRAIEAAVDRLAELEDEEWTRDDALAYMRRYYGKRRTMLATRFNRIEDGHGEDGHEHGDGADHLVEHRDRRNSFRRLQQELLAAERNAVVRLRNRGTINDQTLRAIQRDLDLEELRLAAS